jgi:chromosome segregation ATPase
MRNHLLTLLAATALLAAPALRADDATAETRLKEALKNTLLQLRTVTADRDNLQAQLTDLQTQKDALTQQLADLTKKSADTAKKDAGAIAVLKGQVSDQEDSITQLQASLAKWQDAERKAVTIANDTETKRAKLADLSIHLQRIVDDQKRKNEEMYKTGMEVLDRYEKFGLGEALFAKEPFVGITRTKFETLVQDYEDKLVDAQIAGQTPPGQKPPTPKTQP